MCDAVALSRQHSWFCSWEFKHLINVKVLYMTRIIEILWIETSKAFGSGKAGKVAQKGLYSKCSMSTGTMEEKP